MDNNIQGAVKVRSKHNGMNICQRKCSEDPGTYSAGHVNVSVYIIRPANVIVHNYSQVSDVVGCHEHFI